MGVFVDTSAWYALLDRTDAEHTAIVDQLRAHRTRLTTSNFVVSETITLLRYKVGWAFACNFGDKIRAGQLAELERISPADEDAAWRIFLRYRDHTFSFVDCTSFALMERLGLTTAITLDEDFRTFGFHCLP
jgi:predicted nucleic acid-binding protein